MIPFHIVVWLTYLKKRHQAAFEGELVHIESRCRLLSKMEDELDVYAKPYDAAYPVVCFDERPCFLIGDTVAPIPTQTGKIAKEHYSYEKNGSCCLAAIEPLQGKRTAMVYAQRTKKEYTQFMRVIAENYPDAIKIKVVQDNLNTHNTSSFYEHLPADEAKALADQV